MHVLSYVTRLRSPLLYPFVVLCDLKPLQVSALFGGPLTLGARGKLPLLPPPVGVTVLREAVLLRGELVKYSAMWVGCMVTLNRAAWLVSITPEAFCYASW